MKTYNVLFLCTGNSARSILAEALVDHWGRGRFKGHSAGSFPSGTVHPLALDLLDRLHLPTAHLRSKSWDEFAELGAPVMDSSSPSATRRRARSARSGRAIR
jgi:arsenate reductase